jgi:hypothetical protein
MVPIASELLKDLAPSTGALSIQKQTSLSQMASSDKQRSKHSYRPPQRLGTQRGGALPKPQVYNQDFKTLHEVVGVGDGERERMHERFPPSHVQGQ